MSDRWDYVFYDYTTSYYNCAICDWYRSSTFSSQHLRDDQHLRALNRYGSSIFSEGCGRYFCDLCRCSIFSENNILPHVRGQRHQCFMKKHHRWDWYSNDLYHKNDYYSDSDYDESERPPWKKFKRLRDSYSPLLRSSTSSRDRYGYKNSRNTYSPSLRSSTPSRDRYGYQNSGNTYSPSLRSMTSSRDLYSASTNSHSARSVASDRSRKREWQFLERY